MQPSFYETESATNICEYMMQKWITKLPEKLHLSTNGAKLLSPKKLNAFEFSEFKHSSTIALFVLRRFRT